MTYPDNQTRYLIEEGLFGEYSYGETYDPDNPEHQAIIEDLLTEEPEDDEDDGSFEPEDGWVAVVQPASFASAERVPLFP